MKNLSTDRPGWRQQQAGWFLTLICTISLLLAGCGDSSTGVNGGGNGNGNGGNGNGNGSSEIGTEPTFDNIQQIFGQSCGDSNCHIGGQQSGVQLDSYQNVTGSEGDQYGELVVQANDAAGSPLVDKIEPNPDHGVRMPQGGPYLSDERINQIRTWINNGANNDQSDNDDSDDGNDGGSY
ncbi:hypothetical protein [Halalkalibaculum sp. DA384]|uniref:hypothetical protein n=1 Tax=Halalkalibaculum sp. DA384 TaxID=3373606 RepID=UPI003755261C